MGRPRSAEQTSGNTCGPRSGGQEPLSLGVRNLKRLAPVTELLCYLVRNPGGPFKMSASELWSNNVGTVHNQINYFTLVMVWNTSM